MFSIIIPTAQKNLSILNMLIEEIHSSNLIDEIIIINNHSKQLTDLNFSKLKILEQGKNIYVNPAWNLGVKEARNEYLAILNDDIYLPKEIFAKIKEFILENENCGLIGLDSSINSNKNNTYNNKKITVKFHPANIRNFCWGCAIFGKKNNFYEIPNEIKVWYGDDYLFHKNIVINKKNYKLLSSSIKHYHSLTSSDKCFDEIKRRDEIEYQKYFKITNEIPKQHKVYNILGIKIKIKSKPNDCN